MALDRDDRAARRHAGLADVLSDYQNVDPEKIDKAITPRTKAIMPVHLTGRICQMDEIMEIANRRGLVVIEDAAQAIGSMYKGRLAGFIGHFGRFSAHPLKNSQCAGRTAASSPPTTSSSGRAHAPPARARYGRLPDHRGMGHGLAHGHAAGGHPRLPPRQAARMIAKRRDNAALYQKLLHQRADVCADLPQRGAQHLPDTFFVVQVDKRDELQAHLKEIGIKTAIHHPVPIHLRRRRARARAQEGRFPPMTERQAERILTLPVNQYMSRADVETGARPRSWPFLTADMALVTACYICGSPKLELLIQKGTPFRLVSSDVQPVVWHGRIFAVFELPGRAEDGDADLAGHGRACLRQLRHQSISPEPAPSPRPRPQRCAAVRARSCSRNFPENRRPSRGGAPARLRLLQRQSARLLP